MHTIRSLGEHPLGVSMFSLSNLCSMAYTLYLQGCGKTIAEYSCGRSKVFIRSPQTVFDLESRRKRRVHDLATLIAKVYKGWIQWKRVRTDIEQHVSTTLYYSITSHEDLIGNNCISISWTVSDVEESTDRSISQLQVSLRKYSPYLIYTVKNG